MSIEKEFLAYECGVDYDEYTSGKNLDPRDCVSSEIIDDIENIINEHKDIIYKAVFAIENGCFVHPPEVIYDYLDLFFQQIEEKINNHSSTL